MQKQVLSLIETVLHLKRQTKIKKAQKRNDELRDATREINNLKCEMHEIKSLLKELVNRDVITTESLEQQSRNY